MKGVSKLRSEAEAVAPSNIAIVKYWGKRNKELNLPLNSSLSISLDSIYAKTKVVFDEGLDRDVVIVNGRTLDQREMRDYAGKVLEAFRRIYGRRIYANVYSETNFPDSSGLASSAAGIAALTYAANEALGLGLNQRELSKIARLGSGSACRSTAGGFVIWERGEREDGEDSVCYQLFPEDHWQELVDVIAIVSEGKKKISSRQGMNTTTESSYLLKCRLEFVEKTLPEVVDSIRRRDAKKFFELTMRHSNSMHAVILDSWPSFFYLNDVDFEIMQWVQEFGKAGYTFDAGQNAHVLTLEPYVEEVVEFLKSIGVNRIITSKVGQGPRVLHSSKS